MSMDYDLSGVTMQQIDKIINELKAIMQNTDISQTALVTMLDGKCARNTVLSVMKGEADPRLSTFLMLLDAVGVELRLDTERSKEAILSGDIAEYRAEAERLRAELEAVKNRRDYLQERYDELIEKNTTLTTSVGKQQAQIEKYMERMERAENALYAANEDARRKDAKISELLSKGGKW